MSWAYDFEEWRADHDPHFHWLKPDPEEIRPGLYKAVCGRSAVPFGIAIWPDADSRCPDCSKLAAQEIADYEDNTRGMVIA